MPPCPFNGAHTVDDTLSSIIDFHKDDEIKIKEESVKTGGNIQIASMEIIANPSTTTVSRKSFPIPITAMSVDFVAAAENKGDVLNVTVGEDTIIGAITANVTPATAWVSSNYTAGQTVTYTDPVFGARVYTCMVNTVSNEPPTNKNYWKHGFELTVSNDVMVITMIGYHIKLDDLTNSDNCARVLSKDTINNKIYVEINPTNSYSAASPTFIRQTIFTIDNLVIGEPWNHDLGKSKIGGTYLPADTWVTVHYTNNTASAKYLYSWVELLY